MHILVSILGLLVSAIDNLLHWIIDPMQDAIKAAEKKLR